VPLATFATQTLTGFCGLKTQNINMKTHTWEEYLQLFEDILSGEFTNDLYTKDAYRDYVKMNFSRMNRWLKNTEIILELKSKIEAIQEKQNWYLITEPWCGDAAHSVPFIYMMSKLNINIELNIVLRDDNHDFIDQYLTNGGRSIPKLVARNDKNEDLFVWGPRPKDLAVIHAKLKADNADFDTINQTLQQWYNLNKGVDIQEEFVGILG
jgi:hypothetical protein